MVDILSGLRKHGWRVAVHNDYMLDGILHTFWLFTRGNECVKGEGETDSNALGEIANQLDVNWDFPATERNGS